MRKGQCLHKHLSIHVELDLCDEGAEMLRFAQLGFVIQPKGGSSGATVIEFKALPDHPLVLSGELKVDTHYVFKSMPDSKLRSMDEEIKAYLTLRDLKHLNSQYVNMVANGKSWLILEKAEGPLMAEALMRGEVAPDVFDDKPSAMLERLFAQFLEDQKSPHDEAVLVVFGRVLDRFALFQTDSAALALPSIMERQILIEGVLYPNPLFLFLEAHPNREVFLKTALAPLAEGFRQQPRLFSQYQDAVLPSFLQPKTVSLLPTDPTPLNQTWGDGKTWFDPGRIEDSPLPYPLSKYQGPFAQLFMFIAYHRYRVSLDDQQGARLTLQVAEGAWKTLVDLHSPRAVFARIMATTSGRNVIRNNPLLLLQAFFFGWRQFGADFVYRKTDNDRRADWILFTLGMHHMSQVMCHLAGVLADRYPGQSIDKLASTLNLSTQISELVLASFEACKNSDPLLVIGREDLKV
ncbi:MAG: hypothetical protein AB7F28_05825 [Candidatus Margulisiibacteriota bacterium]